MKCALDSLYLILLDILCCSIYVYRTSFLKIALVGIGMLT